MHAFRLFDDFLRSEPQPSAHGEDSFGFLNRVDQPYWARIRDEFEAWFSDLPSDAAADIRARFRSPKPSQHFGAWWELYLHRFFRCLGFDRMPAAGCTITHSGVGPFAKPTWSPDGSTLAWSDSQGIWTSPVNTAVDGCGLAPKLTVRGGSTPDWGPAR